MLQVPELDNLTYDQIVKRAISRIPSMTDEWTDFNAHDPGITVIQTYAWLVDMLNYYIGATGDAHVLKYLKLLNMEPRKPQPAIAYIIPDKKRRGFGLEAQETVIPAGTKFLSSGMPFENTENISFVPNAFKSCISKVGEEWLDLTMFAGVDGDFAECFSLDDVPSYLYLGFEKPLKKGDRLYLEIFEDEARNDFGPDFFLSTFRFEVLTASGYQEISVSDETGGFLKSGFLTIEELAQMEKAAPEASGEGALQPAAYYLRVSVVNNQMEVLPLLGSIYVNPIPVTQRNTICAEGVRLEQLVIGRTNGCANQKLDFDYPDAWQFSLLIGEGEQATIWKMVDELEQADYMDQCFYYDRHEKMVIFGDGIHGMVPLQNQQVQVTGLVTSALRDGNVMNGQVICMDSSLPLGNLKTLSGATGGCYGENVIEMLEHLEERLLAQERMASAEDYENTVRSTPGLRLDLVHMIPGHVYGKLYHQARGINEVVMIVKPVSQNRMPVLTDLYRKKILAYAESRRLINMKLSIEEPRYVGVEVIGRIELYQNTSQTRELVEKYLREQIDYELQKAPFGRTISYGRIFTGLEAMPEVKRVTELSLERNGNAAQKNERGDLLLNEDALSILEKIDIEFT